jgi:hypothetical protein
MPRTTKMFEEAFVARSWSWYCLKSYQQVVGSLIPAYIPDWCRSLLLDLNWQLNGVCWYAGLLLLWQYNIYKCHRFFGVVLPTESCLEELREQFRRSLMVCTLCTNEFRHLKCSNFHWYEGKLQISRWTCLWLWEEVVSLEPMSQTLPFNDQHMVGKIQIWVAACIPLLNCTSCSRFLPSPLLLPDYGEISFQVWTSDCQCNNFIFDTGFITSLVTNRKMCSALRPDHHLQELVLYLMEILNLQSTLILTTQYW